MKTIELPNIRNYNIEDFIEKFEHFRMVLFDLFGINEQVEKSNKTDEYTEEVGYFIFPCTNTEILYSSDNTRFLIQHFSRENGHIGDIEQDITIGFIYGTKSIKIFVNFYSYPINLILDTTDLTILEIERIELFINQIIK